MEQHTEITVRKFNELNKFRIISQIEKHLASANSKIWRRNEMVINI